MSYNKSDYYGPQTCGSSWEQPCHAGPPQQQGPQIPPQNQNIPYANQTQGSTFPSQNECPQSVPQNQSSAYTPTSYNQNRGNFGPSQHHGHPCPSQNCQCDQFHPQNPGPPQFSPHNHGPMCTPQNQGPRYPNQGNSLNQAPLSSHQNQEPHYPPQHQGPCFQSHNARPQFRSEHQCSSRFPAHNSGPRFPPPTQGPHFPPQNQGPQCQNQCPSHGQRPFVPPHNPVPQIQRQNHVPQGPPQNQGSHYPPLNHGAPFPTQNQGPMGPQLSPLIQPQNQIPYCCPPVNQSPQCPHLNQGPSYQNQDPIGIIQSQNSPCPPNPGPPIPSQNLRPSLRPQNQRPICPPQNSRPLCPPQNYRPLRPPQNQQLMCPPQNPPTFYPQRHQGPRFRPRHQGPNNRPFYRPHYQGPRFPQPSESGHLPEKSYENQFGADNWDNQEEEYTGGCSNQTEEYGVDWDNQNDCEDWNNQNEYCEEDQNIQSEYCEEDWNNQSEYCEEDWNNQLHNHKWKNSFQHSVPSKRGRRKVFFERDFEDPPTKRQRISPNTSTHIDTAIKMCTNNIQINFINLSDMDHDSNVQDNSSNQSEQGHPLQTKGTLQSSEESKTQKNITKASQNTCIMKSNENLSHRNDDVHRKSDSKMVVNKIQEKNQPKPIDEKVIQNIPSSTNLLNKHESTIEISSSTSSLNKNKTVNKESKEKNIQVRYKTPSNTLLSTLTQKRFNENIVLEDTADICTKSNRSKTNINTSVKTVHNQEKTTQNSNNHEDKQVVHSTHTNNSFSKSTQMLSDSNFVSEDKVDHCNSNQHGYDMRLNPKRMKTQEKTTQNLNKHQEEQMIVNSPINSSQSKSTQKLSTENLVPEDKADQCLSNQDEFDIRLIPKIEKSIEKSTEKFNNRQAEQVISNTPTNNSLSKSIQQLSTVNLVLEKSDHCNKSYQLKHNFKLSPKQKSQKEQVLKNSVESDCRQYQVMKKKPAIRCIKEEHDNSNLQFNSKNSNTKNMQNNQVSCSESNNQAIKKEAKNTLDRNIFKNQERPSKNTKVSSETSNIKQEEAMRSRRLNPQSTDDSSNTTNNKRIIQTMQNNEVSCSESNNDQAIKKEVKNMLDRTIFKNQEEPTKSTKVSAETLNVKQKEPTHRQRLNPQSTDGSSNTTNNKSCDKPGNPKETPSIVKTVDSINSESDVNKQIENGKSEIIITNTAGIPCEPTKSPGRTKGSTKNGANSYLDTSINIKKENAIDVLSSKTTLATNNLERQEEPEPEGTAEFANNERSPRSTTNVPSEVALEKTSYSAEDNIATLEKCTDSIENTIIVSDRPSTEDIQQNDESQNYDMQTDYQPPNEDSQTSSGLSRDDVNLGEANLREFDILDEVEGSDNDADQSTIPSEESDSDVSDQEGLEIDEEDIDAMLEEGLDINKETTENKIQKKIRHKVILEEIGHNHFDLLPEGWIQVMHNSGMPVYLHQKARVCAMTRPYFLGPGSVRSHKIPLSAIPCLQYKRALELEKKYEEENKAKQANVSENSGENRPPLLPVVSAKIETAEENEAAQSLETSELQEYCKKIFNFKTISIIPFKTWGNRRRYGRITKDLKKQERPLLPRGTKLLKFPIQNPDGSIAKSKGEWVINPNGKSYVCILHEYVQQALKQHPKYQFKELKNPSTPYSATVFIGEMQYGTGIGASKKYAKLEAAKAALEVLIPEMKDKLENDNELGIKTGISRKQQDYENSIFDQIRIEDPRVAEFCAKTTEPPPYAILATCLQRNGMGLNEVKVEYNMNTKRHKEDEYKMTVKNHTATVMCKNKREGKQKAAQAILKALHPNIEHFGSLLRMYGNHSIKSVKEKKREEQEITGLQCKAAVNQPNFAILNKLNSEMMKLASRKKEQLSKGKFVYHNNLLLPTASTADLKKINL